ncbi:MAG: drug/metabolite transporter (DMT)-like permease [Chitinophagales bacterium]
MTKNNSNTPDKINVETSNEEQSTKGIVLLVIATLLFAGQDAITKHLTQTLEVAQIINVRFFFFSLFAIAFAMRRNGLRAAINSSAPKLQIFRGLLICCEIALFAYTLRYIGLAELHTIFACFPLIVTLLSVPILGEAVGWRRGLAVFVGFIGTVIVLDPGIDLGIDPGTGIFSSFALMGLSCAFMFALYNLITRKVSKVDSFETSLLYFGVVGFLASLLVVPFYWQTPNQDEIFWLLIISITGIMGHLLLIKALQLAPAVILQPFNYFVLLWATGIGFVVYDEILPVQTLAGAALVVASGIFIGYREYKLYQRGRGANCAKVTTLQ